MPSTCHATSLDDAGTPPPPGRAAAARARRAEPDAVLAAAVDLARAAAEEDAEPGTVGEHLGVTVEGERLVTHSFASLRRATGAGAGPSPWPGPRARGTVTVCEVVLLPGRGRHPRPGLAALAGPDRPR